MASRSSHPLIDIGANLADPVYKGCYHGKAAHAPDLEIVLERAKSAGVGHCILTCGCKTDFDEASEILAELLPSEPRGEDALGGEPIDGRRLHSGESDGVEQGGMRSDSHPNPLRPPASCPSDRAALSCSRSAHAAKLLPRLYNQFLTRTIGFHPTRSNEFLSVAENGRWLRDLFAQTGQDSGKTRDAIHARLLQLNIVALGEFGLDYDRLHFSPKEAQKRAFREQLEVFYPVINIMPLFLHSRNCADDFLAILKGFMQEKALRSLKGVVHSYTGGIDEAKECLALGLDIGINGCSLKTQEELEVVAALPLSRLHVETDCPWCEIRRTHASYAHLSESNQQLLRAAVKKEAYKVLAAESPAGPPTKGPGCACSSSCPAGVKSRMEPMHILGVVDVIAAVSRDPCLSGKTPEERREAVAWQVSENSLRLFFGL